MTDIEKEIIWTTSTTGEDFQCVHVDFAREQQAQIERLRAALKEMVELAHHAVECQEDLDALNKARGLVEQKRD